MQAGSGTAAPDVAVALGRALAKVPEWIRQDLSAKDPAVRARAEETLTAILAAALTDKAPPAAG